MAPSDIKQLVAQMDESMPRGEIYRINYSVTDKRTDFFYDRAKAMIKFLQDNRVAAVESIKSNPANSDVPDPEREFGDITDSFRRRLSKAREFSYLSDYNVDGIGFYLKRQHDFVDSEGKRIKPDTTIYASDGKMMGTFYLDDAQAVLQPATERPPVPEEIWSDIAYLVATNTVSHYVSEMPELKATRTDGGLVITGERPGLKNEKTKVELRIDESSLKPIEMSIVYYDSFGKLNNKTVKSWRYQDFAGISLPKTVVDQVYEADLNGNLNLAQERTFTINDFSPGAASSRDSFKGLLKSNFSVYDEITGSHYISGNPEEMLDKLSR